MSQTMPFSLTAEALEAADAEDDPGSLAAATRLRARFGPELAAAAASQVELRRLARAKFGDMANRMFFTRGGLEQASRPEVADYHAHRLAAEGVRRVVDFGCGIGADAMAFARAGLKVVAVQLLRTSDGVFCDPARRTSSGRVWRVEDFTPAWSFVLRLLDRIQPAAVKLGPALPHRLIPADVDAEWVSHRGDTVEVCLWGGPTSSGVRSAMILPDHRLVVPSQLP